jgi:hypothetical protein
MAGGIAILGWGSLIWDPADEFDAQHHRWLRGGPVIKVEFSRVSATRNGALTLVIDTTGADTEVSYCLSKRARLRDAITSREGTTDENIGFHSLGDGKHNKKDAISYAAIKNWAETKGLDAVIWTALQSNFESVCGRPFSRDAAIAHVQSLEPRGKAAAGEYVWRAPDFVRTPVRTALEAEPWFRRP